MEFNTGQLGIGQFGHLGQQLSQSLDKHFLKIILEIFRGISAS